ncbi:helix-turn-helix domain-containing protein [Actinomycetospora chibensis]|uniref:Helix-turn-helix domain-containing protein n=1 Tax=Actinomycetospora chibensis TaxID=663606 RepID=A0ABV9RLZ3_9PSEU
MGPHLVASPTFDRADGRIPTRGPVAELRRDDELLGTRYIETLRAWLGAHGDVAVTAAQLDVHPNTVRYRFAEDQRRHPPRRRPARTAARNDHRARRDGARPGLIPEPTLSVWPGALLKIVAFRQPGLPGTAAA